MPPTPHQLHLAADSLALTLLERQRSLALSLPTAKQDAHITAALAGLRAGLDALDADSDPFRDDDDPDAETETVRTRYAELYTQFHHSAPPAPSPTTAPAPQHPYTDDPPSHARRNKNVRFRDTPLTAADAPDDPAALATRAALFSSSSTSDPDRYTDDPAPPDHSQADNQQIHAHHAAALRDQDAHLDILGQSLGRQKVLGIQMGDELDEQGLLLEDVERGVDRHSDTLTRARRRLEGVARKGKGNWSWVTIGILICVLVLLIVVLK
ncbi:hypothetical protein LTR08_003594 [Meristemomyces frigidus]|nr:hypothetical protein LTR08_003594 [Meristemomyces frigidus]